MIDFDELLEDEDQDDIEEPVALFKSLSGNSKIFRHLRGDQQSILERWWPHRNERDTIIKMNTGAGKTLVGLLIAQSSLNAGTAPVLYLCPDWALAKQVFNQAQDLGIEAVLDESGELPTSFESGQSILITVMQRVYNARSKFGFGSGAQDPLLAGTIVYDDAHTCIKKARDIATIKVNRRHDIAKQLVSRFRGTLEQQSMGLFSEVDSCRPGRFMPVPYWSWISGLRETAQLLSANATDEAIEWSWPMVVEDIETTSCLIGHDDIEIFSDVSPVHQFPTIHKAKRRIYLTATLVDDSALVRDFGVTADRVSAPLVPTARGDIGERMILIPRLVDSGFTFEKTLGVIREYTQARHNTVVLVPSKKRAERWVKSGGILVDKTNIDSEVERLSSEQGLLMVLVNRYDGIDLPDKMCRILVMDGMPIGTGLESRHAASVRTNSRLVRAGLAQRVEQGLGRAVRSQEDYAVVLLMGRDLVKFVGQTDVLDMLTPETRSQVRMSLTMAEKLKGTGETSAVLINTINQCLERDVGWIRYHRNKLVRATSSTDEILSHRIAQATRRAFELYNARRDIEAARQFEAIVDEPGLSDEDKGWFLQKQAQYLHRASPVEAQEKQLRAYDYNFRLLKPNAGIKFTRYSKKLGSQPNQVRNWVAKCVNGNSIVVQLTSVVDKISFGGDGVAAEDHFERLGQLLGLTSLRPERDFNDGPDNLWQSEAGPALILSLKLGSLPTLKSISQGDAEQLDQNTKWFDRDYSGRGQPRVPVLVHPAALVDKGAHMPDGSLILTLDGLSRFLDAVRELATSLATKTPSGWTTEDIDALLKQKSLHCSQLSSWLVEPKRQY